MPVPSSYVLIYRPGSAGRGPESPHIFSVDAPEVGLVACSVLRNHTAPTAWIAVAAPVRMTANPLTHDQPNQLATTRAATKNTSVRIMSRVILREVIIEVQRRPTCRHRCEHAPASSVRDHVLGEVTSEPDLVGLARPSRPWTKRCLVTRWLWSCADR